MVHIPTLIRSLLLSLIIGCCGCTGNAQNSSSQEADQQEDSVTLLFAGDLMQHSPQIQNALRPGGKYDYSGVFDLMQPEIERADIAIANFEVTLGGPPYKGYPQFSAPDEYLQACVDAGFDVLTTCNNHSVDTRARGLERTIKMMDSIGVAHLGTYRNQQERDRDYPFIIEHNGIKVCLLNYTYGTNGIPVPTPYIVNTIDTVQMAADIRKAKSMQPDVIICMPHWGIEYALLPSKEQKDLADWMFRQGVDHIIGGHPHVVEPIEVRGEGDNRHVLAYSLGNFVSNQYKPNTYGGTMVRLTLTKKNGKTTLTDCGYSLYWVSRPVDSGNRNGYVVYPAGHPTDNLTQAEKTKRETFLKTTRDLFAKHNKGIKEYIFGDK